ncbi:MAG: bifunctional acetate--CoA ligase family protein/GNAT family N-acetyltransferase [Lyngbya sp.]|nr:bifunctional acetate--CoA ligase family protein/GNAT family N-acetyltransferase [Lyngbya sp.]
MSATITPTTDPAPDILRDDHQPLNAIFAPRSVAVIGASEKPHSVGRTLLWNLISSPFGGTVFPVNPKRSSILGIKAYPSLADLPEPVDLAVIATPAATVPGVVEDCVKAGVKGAIILSAGFKEIGANGIALEQQILEIARRGNLRIIGPNCLGVMNPLTGLNATFAHAMAKPGNVGFISQSGALCTSILDWSFQGNVGFSAFISIGSMLDVGWGDLIYYLGDDPRTQSIVIYMESIGDARSFLSAAREVALTKPIIVIKAGRTAQAAQAAASHTGALTGSDDVLDAAFRRCGVLRVYNLTHLFSMAEVLAKQPRPKGSRLTILTNAGGPGVLTTDTLISEGGTLAQLSGETVENLNQILPPQWSHSNPIDILGDANPDRYAKALEIAAEDPNSDGLLVILTPQAMTDPTQTAEKLKAFVSQHRPRKPILASWMGGAEVKAGAEILNQAGIATFPYPDIAVRMFNYMWQSSYNLRGLYETPSLPATVVTDESLVCDRAQHIIQSVRQQGRTLLTEFESKQLLATYQIPIVETYIATTVEAAIQAAEIIGYPVVVKLHSQTITHKTDVGGVQLNLLDSDAVTSAYHTIKNSVCKAVGAEHFQGVTVQPMVKLEGYELILGSSLDPQFGPVLLFGTGGQLVEVFKDRTLALPPLNTTLARRMMEQTKIYKALLGVRGRAPVDMDALEKLLVQFSHIVVEHPAIKEIDINPLLASEDRLVALDARVVLHDPETPESQLPKPAIRPYPHQYITHWTSKKGVDLVIRPIRPEDEPMAVKFHESLSEESVYLRYAHLLKLSRRIAHDRLSRLCFIDYNCEMALVAIYTDPQTAEEQIVGVGRLSRVHGVNEAEFSLLIRDRFQHQGLGSELLGQLLSIGRQENIHRITAEILADNFAMQKVCEHLGFTLKRVIGEPMFRAEIEL